jgi:hypothetical protein
LAAYFKQVKNRVNGWKKLHESHTSSGSQITWEEYVNYQDHQTKVHGNSKDTQSKPLSKDTPFLGPHFIPTSYLYIQRRHAAPVIEPKAAYLKSLNMVLPFYYLRLAHWQCKSNSVLWGGVDHHRVLSCQ